MAVSRRRTPGGLVAFFYLDDGPERARWLLDDERQWLVDAILERSS